uniref:Transmembrane protein n=1 Tax=Syphacia muris TaxID=451379 RepID=A0A0N5AQ40_9BILA
MTIWSLGKASKKENLLASSGTNGSSTGLVDAVTALNHGFGIRSYLHQFYQSPTTEESPASSAWYLLPPPPSQRKGLFLCHLLSILGLLILLGGAATIVAGYTWPHQSTEDILRQSAQAYDEEGRVWIAKEDFAKLFQDPMRCWKMVGLCVFSVGASLLALSLLIPAIAQCFRSKHFAGFASEDGTPNEPPIRIYPSAPTKIEGNSDAHISPNSEPVPVIEEIKEIQPVHGKAPSHEGAITADELLNNNAEVLLPQKVPKA